MAFAFARKCFSRIIKSDRRKKIEKNWNFIIFWKRRNERASLPSNLSTLKDMLDLQHVIPDLQTDHFDNNHFDKTPYSCGQIGNWNRSMASQNILVASSSPREEDSFQSCQSNFQARLNQRSPNPNCNRTSRFISVHLPHRCVLFAST